jgi:hypothetical protein
MVFKDHGNYSISLDGSPATLYSGLFDQSGTWNHTLLVHSAASNVFSWLI